MSKSTKVKLQPHQEKVVKHLESSRGLLAIHGTGTGKTILATASALSLLHKKIVSSIYFISPVSLQDNFKKTITRINNNKLLPYYISESELLTKVKYYTIQGFVNKNDSCRNALLIVDEAQNIRTLGGVYFNQILACAKYAKRVLLLSATPIVNYPHDIINLVAILRGVDPVKLTEFYSLINSPVNAKKYFADIFHFYTRSADDINFPKYIVKEKFLPMDSEYEKLYKKIEAGNAAKIPEFKGKNIKVFYNGIRRASNAIKTDSGTGGPKIQFIISTISESPKMKYVIFSHFVSMGINIVIESLHKMGLKYALIDGKVNKRDRQLIVDKYNKKEITILLISKAGGEGLDLKNTDAIFVLEPTWNYALLHQIMGRGVRYKSHVDSKGNPISAEVTIYLLYLIKKWEKKYLREILEDNLLEPPIEADNINDDYLSIDLYLHNYIIAKEEKLNNFMHLIKKYKIKS
jgi:SNF2 family DNA or RNA helicase